ncbi:MAG: ECF-type sigma factor [Isosphaeraceae bacterium]|nr:ECF-type sigma factor [Isosphaeraceae bacterium]
MSQAGSISRWIVGLKGGDEQAAQRLWEHYFERLARLARERLRASRRVGADLDEEDVALSTLKSVCLGAADGRFPRLTDRDGLWSLLVVIAARKVINSTRDERRLKRGGGRVRVEADFGAAGSDADLFELGQVVDREPTPELAAAVAESLQHRLDGLPDDVLRRIAVLRLEGHDYEEIARRLGCTQRTVMRKVAVIRRHWSAEESP